MNKHISRTVLFLVIIMMSTALGQEPLELRGPNKKVDKPTGKKLEAIKQLNAALQLIGDGKIVRNVEAAIKKIDTLIGIHPKYSDAYFFRAMTTLQRRQGSDYHRIISDLDKSIKLYDSKDYISLEKSLASRYSLRAKARLKLGQHKTALEDFEKAVYLSLDDTRDVIGVSVTKPEENSPTDFWQLADFDELVSKCPYDYRAHLFRGYFFGYFTTYDAQYFKPESTNYYEAVSVEPNSPLAHFLMGQMNDRTTFARLSLSSETKTTAREELKTQAIECMTRAIKLNPQFKEAYLARAQAYYSLEKYEQAIEDYDRALGMNADNPSAYNDRGLAHFNVGNYYAAISDFTEAVERKEKGQLQHLDFTYKNRAEAYRKVGDYEHAINDYGKAIEKHLESVVVLSTSLSQFRLIYPELNKLSDQALTRKLWLRFYPDFEYKSFETILRQNEPFSNFVFIELIISRSDACLEARQFKNAIREYNRVKQGFPEYAQSLERWRPIGKAATGMQYLDAESVEFHQRGEVDFWIKEVLDEPTETRTSALRHWKVLCSAKTLMVETSIDYDSKGSVTSTNEHGEWSRIVPGTYGEMLYKAWCGTGK